MWDTILRTLTLVPWLVGWILLGSNLALAAPKAKEATTILRPGQPVRIATMDMPQFGLAMRNAIDLAVEQFGGVLFGHAIQTKHYGRGCDLRGEQDQFLNGLTR